MKVFEKNIDIRWSDCDMNGHVRHSAYYDFGAHCRIKFFEEIGYGASKLNELKLGPILFKEECSFIKELKLNDEICINLLKGEVKEDGSKWILHHEIFNGKKQKAAHITIKGAWMDLKLRKLIVPPKELAMRFNSLFSGNDFVYAK